MTGDAIFHLVPTIFGMNHSHGEEDHDHDHDHDDDHDHDHEHDDHGLSESEVLSTGAMILAGLYIFYLLETLMIFYQVRDPCSLYFSMQKLIPEKLKNV